MALGFVLLKIFPTVGKVCDGGVKSGFYGAEGDGEDVADLFVRELVEIR